MVIAKLEMTETISGDLTAKVLHMSMKEVWVFFKDGIQPSSTFNISVAAHRIIESKYSQVVNFGNRYKEGVREFKRQNFEDRSKMSYFTWYMVAIVNNCTIFGELALDMKARWGNKATSTTIMLSDVEKVIK